VYDVSSDSRFILTIDAYKEDHGEPGGLTAIPAPGAALYQVDRNVTTALFSIASASSATTACSNIQKIFSEHTELDIKAFGGYLSRYSHRQRGGGFGVAPDPNPEPDSAASTNDIQDRARLYSKVWTRVCATTTRWVMTFRPSLAECTSTTLCRIAVTIAV
jgi:hypothetical protein